jgi:hypothetical protein
MSRLLALILLVFALFALPAPTHAQGVEFTLFLGRAFPVYEDRLVLTPPSPPPLPGIEITEVGTPELRADGGSVFGAALAFQLGPIGIEGRLDATNMAMDVRGARYELLATMPPIEGLAAAVTIGDGRFDLQRLNLLSLNLRVATPGPIGLVASGGLSYMPDILTTGTVPLALEIAGFPIVPEPQPRLTLEARPGQADHRWGVNAGAGLRVGGRISLLGEARVFYFRAYQLQFRSPDAPDIVNDLLAGIDIVRFEPVIWNGQVGLMFRF